MTRTNTGFKSEFKYLGIRQCFDATDQLNKNLAIFYESETGSFILDALPSDSAISANKIQLIQMQQLDQ